MVECYLCKGKLRVTRDKHVYDEKLKKRYHFKCFAGICRVCDEPVYTKAKHKTIGSNVWHEKCYKTKHRHNPIKTIDDASWKAMEVARKAADIPRKMWREFEEDWFKEHPPKFEPEKKAKYESIRRKREARENPPLKASKWARRREIDDAKMLVRYGIVKDVKEGIRLLREHATVPADIMAKYEGVRRKREARENPNKYLLFMENEKNAEGISEIKTKKLLWRDEYSRDRLATLPDLGDQIPEDGRWVIPDNKHNRSILRTRGVRFQTWETPTTAEIMGDLPKYRKIVEEDMKENPMLVTPQQETDIVGAFQRVIQGIGTEADKLMVRMAREADVVMSTGPSVLLKRNPCDLVENPDKLDYIIQDEFGTTFETGKGTEEQAEARALHYNQKHMRQFKVIYPKRESPEVKKAAQTAAKEMLKS